MSTGRPRASSREAIADAACELFLEQGYDETSIADIARRAGVSRSSFFNYFGSKSDVLWAGLDARIDDLESALTEEASARAALASLASGFTPDSLALAIVNAQQMGLEAELERDNALRRARIGRIVGARLRREGRGRVQSEILGAAYAAAVLAAVEAWAHGGAARTSLADAVGRALAYVPD